MFINSSKDLALLVSKRRKEIGFTLDECAAWCNVGTRFLFDIENAKSTLQLDKLLTVTKRLGIRLALQTHDSPVLADQPGETVTITAPGYDGSDWLASRAIGYLSAKACGLEVCEQTFDRESDKINLFVPGNAEPVVASIDRRSLLKEEQGGPGFSEIFDAIDKRSASPIEDTQKVIRWACFTYLTGEVNISAKDVQLDATRGTLAPFGVFACASGEVGGDRASKGLRIGREWPDDWLRVDHWLDFAEQARVKPKIVLHLMREMSEVVPKAVRDAAVSYTRSQILRGAPSMIVNVVHARSTRMRDLLQSALHQNVPGLKTTKTSKKGAGQAGSEVGGP